MVIERYIVKSDLMKFQREFFVTTICCLIGLFLPKIILVGIDDPKKIFMLVTFSVSSRRLIIFTIGLISVVEWLFLNQIGIIVPRIQHFVMRLYSSFTLNSKFCVIIILMVVTLNQNMFTQNKHIVVCFFLLGSRWALLQLLYIRLIYFNFK